MDSELGSLHSMTRSEIIVQTKLRLGWTVSRDKIHLPISQATIVTTSKHLNCCWDNSNELIIDDPLAKKLMSFHHSIIYFEGGHYKITDLEADKATFINGMKLECHKSHGLADGDIICFGMSQNNPIFKELDHPKLLFYFKGPNSKKLETFPATKIKIKKINPLPQREKYVELRSSVFGNSLILSEILSSLPPSDLKNMRLVNTTWHRESSSSFYGKTLKKIPPGFTKAFKCLHLDPGFPSHCKQTTLTIDKYVPMSFGFDEVLDYDYEVYKGKVWDNVISYLECNGRCINVLNLELNAADFSVLLRMLSHLHNLVDLKLFLYVFRLPIQFPGVEFKSLKSLSIKASVSSDCDWRLYENLFISVVRMFPLLEQLELGDDPKNDVVQIFKNNPQILTGINRFSAKFKYNLESFFGMYKELLDLRFQHLKSLEFSLLPYEIRGHQNNTKVVTELLRKFSSTLESLSLTITSPRLSFGEDVLTYAIPSLPELKTLELTSDECAKIWGKNKHYWLNFEDLDSGKGKREVDYTNIFPKLKTLIFDSSILEVSCDEKAKDLWKNRLTTPFIKKNGDAKCLTVTRLGLRKSKLEGENPYHQKWLVKLAEIFQMCIHLYLEL